MKINARLFLFFILGKVSGAEQKQLNFEIVIPTWNNEKVCVANLKSALNQRLNNGNYHITIINDSSSDDTRILLKNYIKKKQLYSKVSLINNTARVGALANINNCVRQLPDSTIVVLLDGDDFLANGDVLNRVAHEYKYNNAWVTYGQYQTYPSATQSCCEKFPSKVLKKNAFRRYKWVASHLRTFYAGLFKKIKVDDLKYEGKFFSVAWDLAIMFPILEMSSDGHISFINSVLYRYNIANPFNDFKKEPSLQEMFDGIIRARDKYQPLSAPF